MTKLKPCPFCGGKAEFINLNPIPDGRGKAFRCSAQRKCPSNGWYKTKSIAIRAWNRRAK